MIQASAIAAEGEVLDADRIRDTLRAGLTGQFTGARVLALIPDRTRSMPLAMLFPLLCELLADARQLDFMIALGTHPPPGERERCALVGLEPEQLRTRFPQIRLLNHEWDKPQALTRIGVLEDAQLRQLAGPAWHPSLGGDTPVTINRAALEYDRILIVGPVFPHEVVGISGGAKYLFPGISGPQLIDRFHWLGALITTMKIIGLRDTPVREIIHAAAAMLPTPLTLAAPVVVDGGLAGLFIGDHLEAWRAAADLSRQHHIRWLERPVGTVLSCCPPMYDELWTGGKAMYKLEPVVADGGELIIHAPHLDTISVTHGRAIRQLGYHVLPWFLRQWPRYAQYPTSVIAHCTHVKGVGEYEQGVERPRIQVTLASRIDRETCRALNLGYRDPATIDPAAWRGRAGTLVVPKAGEILYRVRAQANDGPA